MRKAVLIAATLFLPAFAQEPLPPSGEGQNVTVTGIRIQDYRDRLAACLARNCPVNEDADATLALAEALFLNGAYPEARTAVAASLRRNRRRAADFPVPVSDLYRAHSRLSRHIGDDAVGIQSAHGILNALQAGISTPDHRHFTARLELAEINMLMGRYTAARRALNELIREAERAGRHDVAAIAWLRDRWYNYMNFRHGDAKGELIRAARDTDPARRIHAIGARILLARIYRAEGNQARADTLFAEVGRAGASARRRLLHAPPYLLGQQAPLLPDETRTDEAILFGNTLGRPTADYRNRWIDVGFWVMPDGRVAGLEIVRRGAGAEWADPLMASIRRRLYSAGPEASYRLERYTMTGTIEVDGGSRIRRQSPWARAEYLDLTIYDEPPPPGTPPAPEPEPTAG
ncbi:MAG TPA: hypothetical protein VMG08_11275 [Allosphingosinicella sp.]|nr:hypothetical protein [Allosphingosinicella sp.]